MCHFEETVYFCGCEKQCEYFPCKEYVEINLNSEGCHGCPKLGNEDKRTVLESFCDNETCTAREKGLIERSKARKQALKENKEKEERLRKNIEMAREKLRKGREEAEDKKIQRQRAKGKTANEQVEAKMAVINQEKEWKENHGMGLEIAKENLGKEMDQLSEEELKQLDLELLKEYREIEKFKKAEEEEQRKAIAEEIGWFSEDQRVRVYRWLEKIPDPKVLGETY